MRNAGHKERQAELLAQAETDKDRLAVAFAWFRSSTALLARRRAPKGVDKEVHRAAAASLTREMTEHLVRVARAVDRGDYDARKAA